MKARRVPKKLWSRNPTASASRVTLRRALKVRIKDDFGDRKDPSGFQGIKNLLQRSALVRNFSEHCHQKSPIKVIASSFPSPAPAWSKTDVRELSIYGLFFGSPKHSLLDVDWRLLRHRGTRSAKGMATLPGPQPTSSTAMSGSSSDAQ